MRNWNQPCIVIDVDQTLCPLRAPGQEYADLEPYADMVALLREYANVGWYIIIHTARQMRTHDSNVGRIHAHTMPVLLQWLTKHQIPFDEVWPEKPWCGFNGVYVDDHTITPQQFLKMPWGAIQMHIQQLNKDMVQQYG